MSNWIMNEKSKTEESLRIFLKRKDSSPVKDKSE